MHIDLSRTKYCAWHIVPPAAAAPHAALSIAEVLHGYVYANVQTFDPEHALEGNRN